MRRLAQVAPILGLLAATPALCTCSQLVELCAPQQASYDFFSRGDCVMTRAAFFQGHEWLTVLANRELEPHQRWPDESIALVAEGNRRVDWPRELLVHMNSGIAAYVEALTDYTEEPSRQSSHFLLSDRNTSEQAAAEAQGLLRSLTWEAVRYASSDIDRSFLAVGKAVHLLQDSYSDAHARRDLDHPTAPGCIVKVKAYIERAEGFDTPDIEYHGDLEHDDDDDDEHESREPDNDDLLTTGIGHTTTQDSIYRQGRDCHQPTAEQVEGCLSDSARRARDATRDYLLLTRQLMTRSAGLDLSADVEAGAAVDAYIATHLAMCP